jgi:hypothetical protein
MQVSFKSSAERTHEEVRKLIEEIEVLRGQVALTCGESLEWRAKSDRLIKKGNALFAQNNPPDRIEPHEAR